MLEVVHLGGRYMAGTEREGESVGYTYRVTDETVQTELLCQARLTYTTLSHNNKFHVHGRNMFDLIHCSKQLFLNNFSMLLFFESYTRFIPNRFVSFFT